jgi:nucleotide-binding universal stress UspA family protein
MPKILLAVDGSEGALRATRKLIEIAAWYKAPPEVELVTVQRPVPHVGTVFGPVLTRDMIEHFYQAEGENTLAPSRGLLSAAGIRYSPHILVGDVAPTIVEHAKSSGCEAICMGTRGMTVLGSLLLGSVAARVVHLAHVPVMLVR